MIIKKLSALLCGVAFMFSAAGCTDKSTVTQVGEDSVSVSQPESTTKERTVKPANVGEPAELKNVEVTINELYRSEYFGSQDGELSNVIFVDVTITNNTSEAIDANMLTSFEFYVDGELHDSATLTAISSAKKQYGDDVNLFVNGLEPGETQTGYIPAELPRNFDEAVLYCLPLGGAHKNYDPSSAITYTFTKDAFTELAKPDSASEEDAEKETEASEE